jgi:hypothetical protein
MLPVSPRTDTSGADDSKRSRGLRLVERVCGGIYLPRMEMIQLATVFSIIAEIDLPREATRRRDFIINWFDDNYDRLAPFAVLIRIDLCGD